MNNCIFCSIVKGSAYSWKVYETEDTYAFLDIHPASRYHTLVIPKKHYTNIFDIPEEELRAVITTVKKVVKLYEEKLGFRNIQIISNSGAEAQQEVFHLHFHLRCYMYVITKSYFVIVRKSSHIWLLKFVHFPHPQKQKLL